MLVRASIVLLTLSFAIHSVVGVHVDINNGESIKAIAKTFAGSIVSFYNTTLAEDLIPGLFGDDYNWWEAGAIWNSLISYSYLTGDSSYDDLVSEAIQHQIGDYNAFMPANQSVTLDNNGQSTWGLAALTAAEVGFPKPKEGEWVDLAITVFDTQVMRWDTETCNGGLRWRMFSFQEGYNYKNSMSNGNFFLLSARLARLTGNGTYAEWANKSYNWAKEVGLVASGQDGNIIVKDGAMTEGNCSDINNIHWAADFGVYLEGAAVMHNLTKGAQNWTEVFIGLANTTWDFTPDQHHFLVEVACELNGHCDTVQRASKGIAARSLARAGAIADKATANWWFDLVLGKSAESAADGCVSKGDKVECSPSWAASDSEWRNGTASNSSIMDTFAALEVLQGLLYQNKTPVAKGTQNASGGGASSDNSTSGAVTAEKTGAAGVVATSGAFVLAVAFAAALNL
ncbi:glycoside hydrolase family 76 protein [Dothidotthia symphoricarpi CBS 119687]|uniref:Mannan endo-1,6-alpha-mannosidase n=1 Tax=Dothidotthia symphoricarpi CBS 119687 TaxID=1392245 RepID=A0A6A5ZZF1_9PLEO|nr:glycoside hydrolase family 76 protein [Dothidotthia symphoricarpi CBS 119687]KAF2124137.1 glycoside hydrolase family 76 protein [Dothidotthia symphoricarpi CBS 119687]